MLRFPRTSSLVLLAVLAWAPTARAHQPEMPEPGPEHAVLAGDAGTWDAAVESWMAPGQPPMTSKGVETNAIVGGVFLVGEFKRRCV